MSLSSLAVRFCTVEALRGATFAGDAVEDSPVDAIALAVAAAAPLITVFSDAERFKGNSPSPFMSAPDPDSHTLDVTFNIFLPTDPTIAIGSAAPVEIEARDSGGAVAIDLFHRQVEQALAVSDGLWARLWRGAVLKVNSIDSSAYVLTTDKGLRLPAREIAMNLTIIDSPVPGGRVPLFWTEFLDAVRASDGFSTFADLIEAAIQGEPLPEWRRLQALLGLTRGELTAIGDGPLDVDGPETPIDGDTFAVDGVDDVGAAVARLEP